MNNGRQFCFTHTTGEEVFLYSLKNSAGTEVLITNYGCIITSYKVKLPGGNMNDIVLGFDRVEDYLSKDYLESYPWMGCAIGRTANRIKNGAMKIDGQTYQLTQNKGKDNLHGGESGFDKKVWKEITYSDMHLELGYLSVNGEEGYPGNLEVRIRFELSEDAELSYTFRAKTDQPTIVNLTHHSYFNLDNGKGSIDEQDVRIHSSNILAQDEGLVTNGEIIDVTHSIFDLRNYRKIGPRFNDKEIYDQSYLIDAKTSKTELVAEARSELSRTHLKIYSTEPIVHFYSGRWFPEVTGKNETLYGPCSGFCLETHIHPNAINLPHFPNTILRPGEEYFQETRYRVESF
jgi:aldose 1-epimerase